MKTPDDSRSHRQAGDREEGAASAASAAEGGGEEAGAGQEGGGAEAAAAQAGCAREGAEAGLLKLQDQLADLRDNSVLDKAAMTKNLTGKVGETTRSERSLITSKVGGSSGGINTAASAAATAAARVR